MVNAAAQMLGRMAKGKGKPYSPEEVAKRTARILAEVERQKLDYREKWNVPNGKKCHTCLEVKSLDQFYKERRSEDGLRSMCIACFHAKAPVAYGVWCNMLKRCYNPHNHNYHC